LGKARAVVMSGSGFRKPTSTPNPHWKNFSVWKRYYAVLGETPVCSFFSTKEQVSLKATKIT